MNNCIQLITVGLPQFDGMGEEWTTFWDQFAALIHDETDLDPVNKLSYLRGVLKRHSLQLIQKFCNY